MVHFCISLFALRMASRPEDALDANRHWIIRSRCAAVEQPLCLCATDGNRGHSSERETTVDCHQQQRCLAGFLSLDQSPRSTSAHRNSDGVTEKPNLFPVLRHSQGGGGVMAQSAI
ncbi:hypothetical protein GE09DRAFT_750915 [Coniochaeta sp. 2T2.1]|nr:hypothetical protein GE09DRAFT_750915 [Coniochaeta sp. 2T2.1]